METRPVVFYPSTYKSRTSLTGSNFNLPPPLAQLVEKTRNFVANFTTTRILLPISSPASNKPSSSFIALSNYVNMLNVKPIKSALISVFSKDNLEPIIRKLNELGVTIYSTGGTEAFIKKHGIPVTAVEEITSYPSILDGRVKTLHPKVFGGILARREDSHLAQLDNYEIPEIDLVIVDLYPFEETVANTSEESEIIEKIDIGGISLIRAAAKNYKDVVVVPSRNEYAMLLELLEEKKGYTDRNDRKAFAHRAFKISAHYDTAISAYFNEEEPRLNLNGQPSRTLRYGENPHQQGRFYGDLEAMFDKLNGKKLSYNNLVDIDAAVSLMKEFKDDEPTFAVLKHTNACGTATRDTVLEAWKAALAGDPISAYGGILICNKEIDLATAKEIKKLFYEVLIAPSFEEKAIKVLSKKKNGENNTRVLLKIKDFTVQNKLVKSVLNGVIEQDADSKIEAAEDFKTATKRAPSSSEIEDLVFANRCVKHLKSNTIVLARGKQLLGMGCGQTSRIDALKQAIEKAKNFGFELEGAVMASDAFFPFPDCVEVAAAAGIKAVVQPGGSIRDELSINKCDELGLSMVLTGTRHFKH